MASKDGLSPEGLRSAAWQRRGDRRAERQDALHRSAAKALEITRAKREKAEADAAKRPAKSKSGKGKAPKIVSEAEIRSEVNRLVPRETQRNGDYQFVPFTDVEVTEGGKRVKKESRVVRNLGGTPIERWHRRGKFDERQMAAILFFQDAFRRVFGEGPRISANYSPVIIRGMRDAIELYAGSGIAARESLRLLDQEVFFRLPVEHYQVWINVVIFDEAAGVAGSRLGFCHKPAEAVAQAMVGIMASMIADIVLDSSRKDFGDLILDLDAPRRAGRRP